MAATQGRKIFLAVDDTQSALSALKYTIAEVYQKSSGDELHLVHVVKTIVEQRGELTTPGAIGGAQDKPHMMRAADDMMDSKFVPLLKAANIPVKVHILPKQGPMERISTTVGQAICEVAESEGANLIVMAKHDGALKRMLLGSVSKYVVEHCEIPIILLDSQGKYVMGRHASES